jgi:hypothetical protein
MEMPKITEMEEAKTSDGFPRSFTGSARVDGKSVWVVEGYIQGFEALRNASRHFWSDARPLLIVLALCTGMLLVSVHFLKILGF